MRTYNLTVFAKDGQTLLDEAITAENDSDAKRVGYSRLSDENYLEKTYRFVSPEAKLLLFHR